MGIIRLCYGWLPVAVTLNLTNWTNTYFLCEVMRDLNISKRCDLKLERKNVLRWKWQWRYLLFVKIMLSKVIYKFSYKALYLFIFLFALNVKFHRYSVSKIFINLMRTLLSLKFQPKRIRFACLPFPLKI
jgi:hypothetical protein